MTLPRWGTKSVSLGGHAGETPTRVTCPARVKETRHHEPTAAAAPVHATVRFGPADPGASAPGAAARVLRGGHGAVPARRGAVDVVRSPRHLAQPARAYQRANGAGRRSN